MRSFTIFAAVAAATLFTGTASAGDQGEKKDKMVCKKEADSTSRIGKKRTCHTKDEWAEIEAEQQRDARSAIDATSRRN
ncbi:MAG TPA: hypothetical protein VF727_05690 [Allosphingosinicella sp.]|jgi:hypothetical protein